MMSSMPITRLDESERASAIVVHNNTVYLSGQVGDPAGDIKQQTRDTMAKVEALLEKGGSDKTKMLKVEIWLKDIEKDFAPMNEVWNSWVVPGAKPVRCCGESKLARDALLVEIIVTAAL